MNKFSEAVFYLSIAGGSFVGSGVGMNNAADAYANREGAEAAADLYADAAAEAASDADSEELPLEAAEYDDLRAQYDDLRAQYDDLRAQYEASAEAQLDIADIWDEAMWLQAGLTVASGAIAVGSTVAGSRRLVQHGVMTAADSMQAALDRPIDQ